MTYNHRVILKTIAVVILFEGLFMLIPLVFAVIQGESGPASALALTSASCIILGLTVYKKLKYYTLKIKVRESYFIGSVTGWAVSDCFCLPHPSFLYWAFRDRRW